MSKFCCPVCWELIDVLNETNQNLELMVRKHHSNLYPVCLPPWLPAAALERMIQRFGEKLYKKFRQLPSVELASFRLGHNRNVSLESAGESISSAGSTDVDTVRMNQRIQLERIG